MFGKGDATLNLKQKAFNSMLNETTIFTEMKNNGDVWINRKVPLPNTVYNYVLKFEGISGPSALGDIGLDDIKITDGLCPSNDCVYQCANGTCLTSQQVCNFVNDCPNGEEETKCGYNTTLESGTDGWNETSDGLFKWYRGANVLSSGPAIDHTTGQSSGSYIYVDSNLGTTNMNARFASPLVRDSWSTCQATFWYQINGKLL